MQEIDRIVVVGAGPVGLCVALRLAQQEVAVTLVEALGEDNFLEQVPRAGTNHPATLELFDRIGLYDKIEPRGIIAPLFHYWERRDHTLIAEFDHAHLKDDTRFPYVLQCERIKIVEEALKLAKAHPNIELRLSTTFTSFTQDADGVTAQVANPAGETEQVRGLYLVSGEGAYCRARIGDSHYEHVFLQRGIERYLGPFGLWSGRAPDGSVLFVREASTREIYELQVELP